MRLSQAALGQRLAITGQRVCQIEHGGRVDSLRLALRLQRVLGIPITAWVVDTTDD